MERHLPAALTLINRVRVCLNGFIAAARHSLFSPAINILFLAEKLLHILDRREF
jgi:hypothetical protein